MEVWKDIEGYEGLYQVSNKGRVKSLDRIVNKGSTIKPIKGKMLKHWLTNGYVQVSLCKKGNSIRKTVHRLVGIYFVNGRNESRNIINHIDGNRSNNNHLNLEWCTQKENIQHAYKTGLSNTTHRTSNREVVCTLTNKKFKSVKEASEYLKIKRSTLSAYLNKQTKTNPTTIVWSLEPNQFIEIE